LKGQIVQSPGSGQKFEMKLSNVNILGKSDTEVIFFINKNQHKHNLKRMTEKSYSS